MRVFTITRAAVVVPVLMIAGLAAPLRAADETTALPATACASLQGMTIPAAAIGLETSGAEVQTAAMVAASAAGNPNGEYCKVTGIVKPKNPSSPSLEFEVNLPATVEPARAADGRRRLQRHARDRAHRIHAAAGHGRQSAQAGLRDPGQRRRPQVHHRVRWPLRDGRRGAGQLRQALGEEGARRRDGRDRQGVRPRARAVLLHRRLARRPRGARRRGPLLARLRRRRGPLPRLQRHAAPPRLAQRRPRRLRRRRRRVAEPGQDQADYRRRVCEVRPARRRRATASSATSRPATPPST